MSIRGSAFFEQIAANEVDIIKQVIAEFPDIDKDRVYVTGLSLGGLGLIN